ncbi:uncharacterized protein LOC106632029 [Geospiza fortis]|uniref:Cytochrome c oxidase subunit 7C, mitochondrial n=1 Tax=Geospiza fortis TaxID=48883 RepID=A0A8N5I3Z8_GEOFO|nr:uncharacterized protein LOC106632029 [Geospiza fortis]
MAALRLAVVCGLWGGAVMLVQAQQRRSCGGRTPAPFPAVVQMMSIAILTTSKCVRKELMLGLQRLKLSFFPLQNLPFSVDNKWRLLAMMCVFLGSGFGAPFFIVRHQLLKK